MMPQFTPTQRFSARCPSRAMAAGSQGRSLATAQARAAAISSAGRRRQTGPQGDVANQHSLPAGQAVSGLLQAPGCPLEVLDPAAAVVSQRIQRELARLVVVDRVHHDSPIAARPQGDPHRPVDGQRQHEAVVIVGVLPDEVDSSGARTAHCGAVPKRAEKWARTCCFSIGMGIFDGGPGRPSKGDGGVLWCRNAIGTKSSGSQ